MKLKKTIILSIAFCSLMTIGKVSAHISESQLVFFIETGNFKTCVLEAYNEKYAGLDEVAASQGDIQNRLTQITKLECQNKGITSIEGIKYLTGLKYLDLSNQIDYNNNQIMNVNLDSNKALQYLNLSGNGINVIDVSKNTALTNLNLSNNNLGTIDLSKNTTLTSLNLNNNNFSTISLYENTALASVNLNDNKINTIDLSKNTVLTTLSLNNNNLSTLDLRKNTKLVNLFLNNNNLTSIRLIDNTELAILDIKGNSLTTIDLSKNNALSELNLKNNKLSKIDLSKNRTLNNVYLDNNSFSQPTGIKYNLGKLILGEKLSFKEYVKLPQGFKTKVSYTSSNPEIATVDENGNINGVKEGTATITLTSKDKNGNLIYEVNEVTVTKKVISASTTEKTSNEKTKVKNPETSDKGMIYGGGLTLTIGTIIAIRKKLKLLGI